MHFNEMVVGELGAYVYALADPCVNLSLRERIFYIGKGTGNRCFDHAQLELNLSGFQLYEEEHKLERIRKIRLSGNEVEVLIVAHGLSHEAAHELEAVLIPLLGKTNKLAGYGDKKLWLSPNHINEIYDRPINRSDIPLFRGNILFVSLNRQDVASLTKPENEPELTKATLGDWNISSKRSARVDVIVGVKNGTIVSIFETLKSASGSTIFLRLTATRPKAHSRSRFKGVHRVDLEESLRGRSVIENQIVLSKIRPGAGCQYFAATNDG